MRLPKLKHQYFNNTLIVYLNNLDSRNAFDIEMAERLSHLITQERPSSLFLTNNGSSFCAGGNLKFYQSLKTKEEGLAVNRRIKEVLDDLFHLPIPKICHVNGPCYGGGVELVSCFDYVTSSPHSLFGLWQKRIGLSFGWGGGSRLLHRMDLQSLQDWLNKASTVSSYEAKRRGIVDNIVLNHHALGMAIHRLKGWKKPLIRNRKTFPNEEKIFSDLWLAEKHRKILEKF